MASMRDRRDMLSIDYVLRIQKAGDANSPRAGEHDQVVMAFCHVKMFTTWSRAKEWIDRALVMQNFNEGVRLCPRVAGIDVNKV